MTSVRVFGSELSPYSVKVRSYLRYQGIAHEWLQRTAGNQEEFQRHAKLPLIPLVVLGDDPSESQTTALQDSTPILEHFERRSPRHSIEPDDPVAGFVSALIEEFADEWGNKWMFHYRWAREADRLSAAGRIARSMVPEADDDQHQALRDQIVDRMTARIGFVGSSEHNAQLIERSFLDSLALLERHLADRRYLFGARPVLADFGLWAQLYEAWTDPTPGGMIEARAPRVLEWIQRMLWPRAEGALEELADLEPTLAPLLAEQVGALFLPWSLANAEAIQRGSDELEVDLGGHLWRQTPQKYHAKSLAVLLDRRSRVEDQARLAGVLERVGCRFPEAPTG